MEMKQSSYFDRFLHVFGIVLLDVMMRPNGIFQFFIDNDSRSLCAWTSDEEHQTSRNVGVQRLQLDETSTEIVRSFTSNKPTATANAAPVDRNGRFPW